MTVRKDTLAGIFVLGFGLTVGGAGLASAGVGIAIPVIPIGLYLIWRGYSIKRREEQLPNEAEPASDSLDFEKSTNGQVGIGVIILLVGIGTSAKIIGIPVAAFGGYLIYKAIKRRSLSQQERRDAPQQARKAGDEKAAGRPDNSGRREA